jgi:hypothetical protein
MPFFAAVFFAGVFFAVAMVFPSGGVALSGRRAYDGAAARARRATKNRKRPTRRWRLVRQAWRGVHARSAVRRPDAWGVRPGDVVSSRRLTTGSREFLRRRTAALRIICWRSEAFDPDRQAAQFTT